MIPAGLDADVDAGPGLAMAVDAAAGPEAAGTEEAGLAKAEGAAAGLEAKADAGLAICPLVSIDSGMRRSRVVKRSPRSRAISFAGEGSGVRVTALANPAIRES